MKAPQPAAAKRRFLQVLSHRQHDSAQVVQAWLQSKQASMHFTSASASMAGVASGFVSIICRA